jgi:hypothetical protein
MDCRIIYFCSSTDALVHDYDLFWDILLIWPRSPYPHHSVDFIFQVGGLQNCKWVGSKSQHESVTCLLHCLSN